MSLRMPSVRLLLGLPALLIFLVLAAYLPVAAGTPDAETTCIDNGGTWEDTGPAHGTCSYPEGNAVAKNTCGAGYRLEVYYIEGIIDDQECFKVRSKNNGNNQSEKSEPQPKSVILGCESRVDGPNLDPVTVYLCYGYNGYINFPAGACPEMCLLGFILPYEAANDLPSGALATLYVMLDDIDGSPYNGSYRVCFANDSGDYLSLYRYVSGEWRVLNTSDRAMVCADASGDGAFYLGPPPA